MADQPSGSPQTDIEVDLRNPVAAGILAWLIPGAGHIYQGRHAKGVLFAVCILGTYFFGLAIGGGHVVYASWAQNDRRWQYFCQVGAGLPALPAIVQNRRVRAGKQPLLGDWMAPPAFVWPKEGGDPLHDWHKRYHVFFELGTLYTMIAGLLNVLAIYDATSGPFVPPAEMGGRGPPDENERKKKGRRGGKGRPRDDEAPPEPSPGESP